MPEFKSAELIKGAVYLAGPVTLAHGSYHTLLCGWLSHYVVATKRDLMVGVRGTVLSPDGSAFQPDVLMLDRANLLAETDYLEQIPEFVVEICYSSQSYDLGPKLAAYRAAGLREYVAVLLRERRVEWRVLHNGRYRLLHYPKDGILPSPHFAGLWLDTGALFPEDRRRLLAAVERGVGAGRG